MIALAHEGHQAITKMKAYLRSQMWFPTMDSLIDNFVRSCLACQATTPQQRYEPLTLAPIPEGPWQQLAMDFKGLGLWLETRLNTNHSLTLTLGGCESASKSSASKVKFRLGSKSVKRVLLKLPNLFILIKQNSRAYSQISQLGRIAIHLT